MALRTGAVVAAVLLVSGCDPSDEEEAGGSSGGLAGSTSDGRSSTASSDASSTETGETVGASEGGGESGAPTTSGSSTGGEATWDVVGCEPIGTVDSDGVFSLQSFAGRLLVGQFGYGREAQSMLFEAEPWQKVEPGLRGIGESVCAMTEHGGWLIANTENGGDIFRSADGTHWEHVHDGGAGFIGCDLVVHDDGNVYAVQYDFATQTHGRILRSSRGADWEVVYDSGGTSRYLREIASHRGALMAFSTDVGTGQGYVHRSVDGAQWSETLAPARFFRTTHWNDTLWLSSTERSSTGVSGIWREEDGNFELVETVDIPYVTALAVWRDAMFAATSDGWKDDVGNAQLLMSRDGESWSSVCGELPELAAWDLAVHEGRLFVGTWQFGGVGRVYEVLTE